MKPSIYIFLIYQKEEHFAFLIFFFLNTLFGRKDRRPVEDHDNVRSSHWLDIKNEGRGLR